MIIDPEDPPMVKAGMRVAYRYRPCPCCKKPMCMVHDSHLDECACRKGEEIDYDFQEYDGILYAIRKGT